ncbi:MAG: hypothetical protein ACE5KR_04115 [Candidatus Bipolaricaulia bacterium]
MRRPLDYAVFRMVDIVYLGEARPFDPRNPRGHFKATLAVEYLVPLESAKLRLVLADQSKGIRVYDVTEGAKGEGLRSYPIEFDLPLDLTARSYSELFEVEVSYQAEGEWHVGDSASRSTQVSISEEAVKAQPERGAPQASPLKPLIDFFRRLFS